MSNIIRTSNSKTSKKLRVAASLLFVAMAVSGCSTLTRFDFPIFGLGDDESEKTSSVRERGHERDDVNRVYPPLKEEERSKRDSYYRGVYDREPERRSSITRSELPEPAGQHNSDDRYSDTSRRELSSRSDDGYEPGRHTHTRNQEEPVRRYRSSNRYEQMDKPTGSITVVAGDTLYSLARNNNIALTELKRANGLRGNTIHVGQTLILPGKGYVEPARSRYTEPVKHRYSEPVKRRYADRYSSESSDGYVARDRYKKRYNKQYEEAYRKPRRTQRRYEKYDDDRSYRKTAKKKYKKQRKQYAYNSYSDEADKRKPRRVKRHNPIKAPDVDNERGKAKNYRQSRKAEELARKRREERDALAREKAAQAKADRERRIAERDRSRRERAEKEAEQKKIRLASRTEPQEISMPKTSGRFRWPVKGRIISKFGAKRNGARNDGINFSVPYGTDVKAAADGVVAYAGNELKGYGNLVLIRHRNKWVSAYAHNSKLLVRRGQRIRRGHVIAKAGKSGSVSQPQVHFELRREAKPVDPLKYM